MGVVGTQEDRFLVFQCRQCRAIVGDSSAYDSSDPELKLVCLRAVSGVVIDLSTLVKSTAGKDTGSSVSPMKCKACAAQLGVSYRTTPRSLDGLRDKFSFNTDAISSYEIGKPEIEMEGEDGEATADKGQHEPSNGDEGKQENGRETASLALRVDAFEEQMLKVENMLLLYNERFDQLEKWVAQAGPPGKRQRKLVVHDAIKKHGARVKGKKK